MIPSNSLNVSYRMSSVTPQPRFPANRVVYASPDVSSVLVFLMGAAVSSSALRFLGASAFFSVSSESESESSESSAAESLESSSDDYIMVSSCSIGCVTIDLHQPLP